MFAQLGSTVFQNLLGFSDLSRSGEATYAEHKPLIGKPRLQSTGLNLDEISLTIRLHAAFCSPKKELDLLKEYRDNSGILPFVLGTGEVVGNFLITTLSEVIEDADSVGNIFCYNVSLTLKECVQINQLQAAQMESKKEATAVGNIKPVAKKKTNVSTCPKLISDIVSKIANHQKRMTEVVSKEGGTVQPEKRNRVLHDLSASRLLVEDLLRRCDNPASCASTLPDLKYRATQVFLSINQYNAAVANNNYPVIPSRDQMHIAVVRNLKTAAAVLVKQSATGNG